MVGGMIWGNIRRTVFQPYIRSASGMTAEQKVVNKPDHSSAGAMLAKEITGLLSAVGLLYSRTSFGIAGLDFFRGG